MNKEPTTEPTAEAPADLEAAMLTAMDEGIAAAEPVAEPIAEVATPAEVDKPAGDPVEKPEVLTASEAEAKAAKEAEAAKAPDPVDAEIAELKLSERSASRFRELTGELKTTREALAAVGITDVAALPALLSKATERDELVQMVFDTGATPEQYGQALDYIKTVNAAAKGDRKAAEVAYATMEGELKVLAQFLGKEIPGVHDPLAAHADLLAEVTAGDLARTRALEIAAQRQQSTVRTQADEQAALTNRQAADVEAGRTALAQWDAQMVASDPSYAAKRDILSAQVGILRQNLPPSKWLDATQRLYATLPNPAPAPVAVAKPAPGPVRPGRSPTNLAPDFATPEEAMEWGIQNAR